MRLVTYGPQGGEQPGILVGDDRIRPLLPVLAAAGIRTRDVAELLALWPAIAPLANAASQESDGCIAVDDVRLGPPVPSPGTIVAIGFTYSRHGAGILPADTPSPEPVVFLKPPSSISGPADPLVKPPETTQLDYEVELGVVVGRVARRVPRDKAGEYIAGYLLANDVTARDIALGAGLDHPLLLQIPRGKGFPGFCPTGPWLLTADALPAEPLRLQLSVNGELRQDGRTSHMTVDVPGLVESVTASIELRSGDLILTGTPAGCGFQLQPPRYLDAGDRVRASITGLGEMNLVVTDESRPAVTLGTCEPAAATP